MSKNKISVNLDGLFRQNIVLMSGIVTAPIIAAATSGERAVVLVLSFFMISYPGILLCRFIPKKIVYTVRTMLYAAVAAVLFIPTLLLLEMWFPETTNGVVIYIELLVVNSLLLAKTEGRFYLKSYGEMAIDALIYIIGYAVAAFAVGIIRELLAYGTFFGMRCFEPLMPAAKSPFFGFLLVGVLAAVCRAISGKRVGAKQRASSDKRREGTQ